MESVRATVGMAVLGSALAACCGGNLAAELAQTPELDPRGQTNSVPAFKQGLANDLSFLF